MNRSAIALGASVIAFAIPVTGAAAAPSPQVIESSVAAVQAGSVQVNAPVRVLSDGDNAGTGGGGTGTAGPQSVARSIGALQVGWIDVFAPIRVLSDGDNAAPGSSPSGGSQTILDSIVAGQIVSPVIRAPVNVLSDGDATPAAGGTSGTGPASGGQTITDTLGGVQLAPPVIDVPIAVASDDDPAARADPGDGTRTATTPGGSGASAPRSSGDAGTSNGGAGSGDGRRPGATLPAVDFDPGGSGVDPVAAMQAGQASELDSGLPFTGLGALALALTGLLFLLTGRGLLVMGSRRGQRLGHAV